MSNILIYDSGIGGLSVLSELNKNIKGKNLIYFGDNFNAPYGSKHELRLFDLIYNNILKIPFNLELIVLACNTASLSVRNMIEESTNVKTIGVYPCVEKEILSDKKTLLLGTPLTVSKIKDQKNLTKIGLNDLALDIERKIFNLNSLDLSSHFMGDGEYSFQGLKRQKFDSVILGCTHYHFIEKQIFNHFRPLKITSGNYFAVNEILKFYNNAKSLEIFKQNRILFFGKNATLNKEIFEYYYKNP